MSDLKKLEAAREAFRRKITSLEAYKEAADSVEAGLLEAYRGTYGPYELTRQIPNLVERLASGSGSPWVMPASFVSAISPNTYAFDKGKLTADTWWLYRETMRMVLGVYPPVTQIMTACVAHLNLFHFCIHRSSDPAAPEAVCYTPTRRDGLEDRQIKVSSLAKLLGKLNPLLSDDFCQRAESMHRSELSDDDLFFATTPEEIYTVYTNLKGDTGCMRYLTKHWGFERKGMHPSNVYATPGVAVAYILRDGQIAARSIVHETNGRKEYVRVYGDAMLARKLARKGYEYGSLAGVKLRAVPRYTEEEVARGDGGRYVYVMPYVDGGLGNSNQDGRKGFIDKKDPEFVQLLSAEHAAKLEAMGVALSSFGSTAGSFEIVPIDVPERHITCALTGDKLDTLIDNLRTIYKDGQLAVAGQHAASRAGYISKVNWVAPETNKRTEVFVNDIVPVFAANGRTYIDTEAARRSCGLKLLSQKYYLANSWELGGKTTLTVDGDCIRIADSIALYDTSPAAPLVYHISTRGTVTGPSTPFRPAGELDTIPIYVNEHGPLAVKMPSARFAVKGVSSIVRLFGPTETWAWQRDTRSTSFYGTTAYWSQTLSRSERFTPANRDYAVQLAVRSLFGAYYGESVENIPDLPLKLADYLDHTDDRPGLLKNVVEYIFAERALQRASYCAGILLQIKNGGRVYALTDAREFSTSNGLAGARAYAENLRFCLSPEGMQLQANKDAIAAHPPEVLEHLHIYLGVLDALFAIYDNAAEFVERAFARRAALAGPEVEPEVPTTAPTIEVEVPAEA